MQLSKILGLDCRSYFKIPYVVEINSLFYGEIMQQLQGPLPHLYQPEWLIHANVFCKGYRKENANIMTLLYLFNGIFLIPKKKITPSRLFLKYVNENNKIQ